VTLSGTVDSWVKKRLSGSIAKEILGVRDVNNTIAITYPAQRTDEDIRRDVAAALSMSPYIDEALIKVSVKDGKVTLSGSVGSAAEKTRAHNLAWVAGVQSVTYSDLDVQWWARDAMRRTEKYITKTDQEIEKAVNDALLYDPRVVSFGIQADVRNGVATLTGTVDNLQAKRAAESTAGNTIGVWSVRNHIKVRPADPPEDAAIAQNVRDALKRNAIVNRYDITVHVFNRTVYLTGQVDSHYEKMAADDAASRVPGVVHVQNNLAVEYAWVWKSDRQIKDDIESKFFWSPFIKSRDIHVSVENGVATLTGKADNVYDARYAIEKAFEGGAKHVISKININDDDTETTEYYYYTPPYVAPIGYGYSSWFLPPV
jgi:osmotically-inducible protein OsmY